MYLYGYVVQQTVHFLGLDRGEALFNALLSLIFTTGLAVASWKFVERPVLSHRYAIRAWLENQKGRLGRSKPGESSILANPRRGPPDPGPEQRR